MKKTLANPGRSFKKQAEHASLLRKRRVRKIALATLLTASALGLAAGTTVSVKNINTQSPSFPMAIATADMDVATKAFVDIANASCLKAHTEGFTESAKADDGKLVTLVMVPASEAINGKVAAAFREDTSRILDTTDWFSACAAYNFFLSNGNAPKETAITGVKAKDNGDNTWTLTVPGTPNTWQEVFRIDKGIITAVWIQRKSGNVWTEAKYGKNPDAPQIIAAALRAPQPTASSSPTQSSTATPTPASTK